MTERQRELISSFRRLVRTRLISPALPLFFFRFLSFFFFLFFSFLFSPFYLVGRRRRINDSDRMTCDFSGIGRNNRSETLFRSFRFAAQALFTPGLRVIRKFYFTRPSVAPLILVIAHREFKKKKIKSERERETRTSRSRRLDPARYARLFNGPEV